MAKFLILLTSFLGCSGLFADMDYLIQRDPDNCFLYEFSENLEKARKINYNRDFISAFEATNLLVVRMQIDYILGNSPPTDKILLWKINLINR